jgi:hypothetical protein
MILPSSNLQPERIIKILREEKVTKAKGVPSIWLGVFHAMKLNLPKKKSALEEYLVAILPFQRVLLKVLKSKILF